MNAPAANPASPAAPLRRTLLSREGKYWLGAFACLWVTGWTKGINLILLLAYLMLALWCLNWIIARRSLRGLRARRIPIEPLFAGAESNWHVEVETPPRKSATGWELRDSGPDHAVQWFVPQFPGGESARLRSRVRLPRRGAYDCDPLRATSSYPFGLVRQDVSFGDGEPVTVYPAIGAIDLNRLRRWLAHSARPDERSRRNRRRLTHEMEFHGLRTFQPGDSPRWIHWRTSARKGELMVREFDQGTHHDLLLILELVDDQPDTVDPAISLAATIVWQWARDTGDRIVLAVAGGDLSVIDSRVHGSSGAAMMSALAAARADARPDLTRLAVELENGGALAGAALLVTNRRDRWSAEFLERRLDRPVARLHPADQPEFYDPPKSAMAT